MQLRAKEEDEIWQSIINSDAISLRRTACKKYFQGSKIEIWKIRKNYFLLVWNFGGFYYGFEANVICYQQLLDTRKRMLDLEFDNSGVAF